jgi:glycerol-3-phosphate O-acyltransferase
MVRDARVILAREMRHAILKITGGDPEKESARPAAAPVEPPAAAKQPKQEEPAEQQELPLNTSEELHERHVIAEHREHEHHAPAEQDKD